MARRKVLIVRLDAIGDFLLFSGALRLLRQRRPDWDLTFLVQDSLKTLASNFQEIDTVLSLEPERFLKEPAYTSDLLASLREKSFDVAIYPVFSREILGDFVTLNSGAPETVTFAGNLDNTEFPVLEENSRQFTKCILLPPTVQREIDRYPYLLEYLLSEKVDGDLLLPQLSLADSDREFASKFLEEAHIKQPFFALSPYPKVAIREWPVEKWKAVLESFRAIPMVILGSEADQPKAKILMNLLKGISITSLCGRATLFESAAILEKATLNVGVESGLFHVATAVGTPSVVITGGGHYGRFVPYSFLHHPVVVPMHCFGCGWKCIYDQAYCVKDIGVELVIDAVKEHGFESQTRVYRDGRKTRQAFMMGAFYKRIGENEIAKKWFQKVLHFHEEVEKAGAAYFHLGEMALEADNPILAANYLERCIELIPDHRKAVSYLSDIQKRIQFTDAKQ